MSRAEGVWGEAQIANYLRRRRYELLAHRQSKISIWRTIGRQGEAQV